VHIPGSARIDDILLTALEKLVRALCRLVLREEKLGPIDVDKEESPGPVYI
jgi:hypothetical protein